LRIVRRSFPLNLTLAALWLVVSHTARAGEIYTLEDVTFTNGATASGSFYYSLSGYVDIDITISSPYSGAAIQYSNNTAEPNNPFSLVAVDSNAPDLTGADFLSLSFLNSLYQGFGSYVSGSAINPSTYGICTNSTCSAVTTVSTTPYISGAEITDDPGPPGIIDAGAADFGAARHSIDSGCIF
jgi:hypothetical protein